MDRKSPASWDDTALSSNGVDPTLILASTTTTMLSVPSTAHAATGDPEADAKMKTTTGIMVSNDDGIPGFSSPSIRSKPEDPCIFVRSDGDTKTSETDRDEGSPHDAVTPSMHASFVGQRTSQAASNCGSRVKQSAFRPVPTGVSDSSSNTKFEPVPAIYPIHYPRWELLLAGVAGVVGILCKPFAPEIAHYLLFDVVLQRYRDFAFRTGSIRDMQGLIRVHRAALIIIPLENPRRFVISRNFGFDLMHYFGIVGNIEDLEESIRALREALSLRPPHHPDRSEALTTLAFGLQLKFVYVKRPEIVEESIALAREAVQLLPPHLPRQRALRVLSEALRVAFTNFGYDTVDESIETASEALLLCPPGHEERYLALAQLSGALKARYQRSNQLEDLDKAVMLQREGLSLLIRPKPAHLPVFAYNLLLNLWSRYERTQQLEDLLNARAYSDEYDQGLAGYDHHPAMALLWVTMGRINTQDSSPERRERAFVLFEKAATHPASQSIHRMEAAFEWASYARVLRHPSAPAAYAEALRIVDECLLTRPSVEWQREFLAYSGIQTLAHFAVSHLIELCELEKAIEVLERGRARLWSRLQGYRSHIDIDRLRQANPELANRFAFNTQGLNSLALSRIMEFQQLFPNPSPHETAFEYVLTGQRLLSADLAKTVDEIRVLDGFQNFLVAEPYSHLEQAAAQGPVIIVNTDIYRADAILIQSGRAPSVVSLSPNRELHETVTNLSTWLNHLVTIAREERYSSQARHPHAPDMLNILRTLWTDICRPIVDRLLENGVPEQSRIWWCPTGSLGLLPLHAAGPYAAGERNLSDIFISSYAPTLSSLIAARSKSAQDVQTQGAQLLAVGQSNSLPKVQAELRQIQQIFSESASSQVHIRDNTDATVGQVLQALQTHPWVHFACHGSLRPAAPFESSFILDDGPLSLLSIAKAQLPNAELAFLAACHTAAGDSRGSVDEALSLAGALQFCGFKSVVGTLWVMEDSDGPELARLFYRHMVGGGLDYLGSATALHRAVRDMQERGVPAERWSTFVHIGA